MGVFPHEHDSKQYGLIISSYNYIADWMIFLVKTSIAGLALATSQLATTDLPERSHQLEPNFIFQNLDLKYKGKNVTHRHTLILLELQFCKVLLYIIQ